MIFFPFDNTYARLPERFFVPTQPTQVRAPRLIRLNRELAWQLGLDAGALAGPEGAEIFAGNRIADGSQPIATVYAAHQFGGFVPQLGDGRAILLGEVVDQHGVRRDIQLKGAGPTPFSRRGDGRAALGPVLREYIVSEAMTALGIPSTRALAAVLTGEKVYREEPLPGAVLARVAASHIRVGTFQFFASRGDVEGVRTLADHVIARHYPDAARAERPYHALLAAVIAAQANLIARWMLVGFIHGVMNTDNMSVASETIDYGPCAFMDGYDSATVFSAIDSGGRYAYANQPAIGGWNLTRLAECLLPLFSEDTDAAIDQAKELLAAYTPAFERAYHAGLRHKLGLSTEQDGDTALGADLLKIMGDQRADFTLTFRRLCDASAGPDTEAGVRSLFTDPSAFDGWLTRWRLRLAREEGSDQRFHGFSMRDHNPAFIPRNHRVEAVIQAAVDEDNFGPFEELLAVLAKPFEDQPDSESYAQPPQTHERVYQTFCGT